MACHYGRAGPGRYIMNKIDIAEIEYREDNVGPYEWMDPATITGINEKFEKEKRRIEWEIFEAREPFIYDLDEDAGPDVILTQYFDSCIEYYFDNNKLEQIEVQCFVNVALYIMINLGSHHPVLFLDNSKRITTEKNAKFILNEFKQVYQQTKEPFVRENLRDFILEKYKFGYGWIKPKGKFADILSEEENGFLEFLLKNTNRNYSRG